MKYVRFFLLVLACVSLLACETEKQFGPRMGIVDVERVMRESVPAQAARKHLEEAQAVLQKGMDDLEKEWKDAPETERRKAIAEGLTALNRQMVAEETSANALVMKLLQEECEKWRATKKAVAVTSKQNLLASDAGADITAEIVAAMNARVLEFKPLPAVQVKKREGSEKPTDKPKEETK